MNSIEKGIGLFLFFLCYGFPSFCFITFNLDWINIQPFSECLISNANSVIAGLIGLDASEAPSSPGFGVQQFRKNHGKGLPSDHLQYYARVMVMNDLSKQQIVHLFSTSLEGPAAEWYLTLDKATWDALVEAFLERYSHNISDEVSLWDLEQIRQEPGESFLDYFNRWADKVNNSSQRLVYVTLFAS
ncbi:hypothetical protein M5689_011654 [Euphorbia peplus]|nr:hypothetical protein M5689_011654 [Euphorbia peplus]